MVYNVTMDTNKNEIRETAEMWKYLTGFEKYKKPLPIYISNPFTQDQLQRLRDEINSCMKYLDSEVYTKVPGDQEEYTCPTNRFAPKRVVHMSRLLTEFECPQDIIDVMDSYVKEVYHEEIKLCHYTYIEYNLKHGNGKNVPSLSPHIDGDENLVTFNIQIGGNIDWDLIVESTPYNYETISLKTNDAALFSAVNQVHWRPPRKWKDGEYVEIISFDYCPLDNYKFVNKINPIDARINFKKRQEYIESLGNNKRLQNAWTIYNKDLKELNN